MADSDNDSGGGQSNVKAAAREQDHFLPIANVSRIMKKGLPANAKISKDAKETVQECVSEFISFVTGEASDKCLREKRKTVNGDDLLWAMATLGFENYVEPLKVYLQRFREMEGEKGGAAAAAAAAPASSQLHDSGGNAGSGGFVSTPAAAAAAGMYGASHLMSWGGNNYGQSGGGSSSSAGLGSRHGRI